MFQRDYLMRMVEQMAEALARAIKLLFQKKPEEAEQALAEGYVALGMDVELLSLLDGSTLRAQLGDSERLAMAARLLVCDAELCLARGARSLALQRLKAARKLHAQLQEADPELDEELQRTSEHVQRA